MSGRAGRPARGRASRRRPIPTVWQSLATGLAIVVALGGLNRLLAPGAWWVGSALVAVVVVAAIGAARYALRRAIAPTAVGVVALVAVLTLVFAADTAVLGIVPTPGTLARFADLLRDGGVSIQEQGVPADAVQGILFILAVGAGVVAIVVDALTMVARSPVLAGLPLLAIVLVPGFIDPEYSDPVYFVLAAAAWLLLVFAASTRTQPGVAFGVAAAALVAALVVPIALPAVEPADSSAAGEGYATGLNPIIDLGNDLRRDAPVVALTYSTTATDRQYLRMTTLDDFTDASWEPSVGTGDDETRPSAIATAPGRGTAVPIVTSTTTIKVGNVRGRWLPVPYAPRSVTGLVGSWTWDPETLNVRTERSSVRGQEYVVATEAAAPTSDQLRVADPVVAPDLAKYLALPESLPPIVASEALAAVGGATTNYDKALALQEYFRGGEFTYSEESPVDDGYDGTGAEVIGTFLEKKEGYCVHFASAMAAMARTLGIPARIAVGFTTGSERDDEETGKPEFEVTTDDLHAWPELYFAGVGWTRFEPTVGRTNVPVYVDAVADDPATPDIDESTATAPPTDSPDAAAPERDDSGAVGGDAAQPGVDGNAVALGLFGLALLVALAIPALARVARRRARVRGLHHGSPLGAWDEVRDTAADLGWRSDDAETPREFADRLTVDRDDPMFGATGPIGGSPVSDPAAVAALARLRSAVERESFARSGGGSRPGPGGADPRDDAASVDDLRLVLDALRGGVGRRARLRAGVAPTSVLARWFAVGVRWRNND